MERFRTISGIVSVLLMLSVVWGMGPAQAAESVDNDVVILANGNILTMNPDQPSASAMAIQGGKILAVGDLDAVKKAAGDSYEYIDFEGKTVVPGFIETHDHLVLYGAVLPLSIPSPAPI